MVFKCEHEKKLGGFVHVSVTVKIDWVVHFHGFNIATLMSLPLELGRRGAYLSIESTIA